MGSITTTTKTKTKIHNLESSKPNNNNNSIVEEAIKQRNARKQIQNQILNATIIQSHYRKYKSNERLRYDQRMLYDQRIHDIITLKNIIKESTKKDEEDYIVPCATIT